MDENALQHEYYAKTAGAYDDMHVHEDDAHTLALCWLSSIVDSIGANSLLDVGSGTGRTVQYLRSKHPLLGVVGVEPVEELRKKGYEKGISAEQLVDGDATDLPFRSDSFDIVSAFGALHHIKRSNQAVTEMARVARMGVFLSDANCFGQGPAVSRVAKQLLHTIGLWPLARFLKTGGRGFHYSQGDGVFYSYSVFESIGVLKTKFPIVHYMNTQTAGINLFRSAPTIAVFSKR